MLATAFSGLIAAGSMAIRTPPLFCLEGYVELIHPSHITDARRCWKTIVGGFCRELASGNCFAKQRQKQEWLFIIEGSMTVGIALMLLPLLPDYPLQSKHLFLSRKMQLYAVRDIQALVCLLNPVRSKLT